MSWTALEQLGLAMDLPTQLSPKAKLKPRKKSKSAPIKRQSKPGYVTLAPGELDDDINF